MNANEMKINPNQTEKLTKAISDVEKGCRVRTVSPEDIDDALQEIDEKMSAILPKKAWVGVRVRIDICAQKFPNAYNGTPRSTQVLVERFATGWFVTGVDRLPCGTNEFAFFGLDEKREQIADYVISKM